MVRPLPSSGWAGASRLLLETARRVASAEHVSKTDHFKEFQRLRDLEAAMPAQVRVVVSIVTFLIVAVNGLDSAADQAVARTQDAALALDTPSPIPADQVFQAESKPSTQVAPAEASLLPTATWLPLTPEPTKPPLHQPVTPSLKEAERKAKDPLSTVPEASIITSLTPSTPPVVEEEEAPLDEEEETNDEDSLYYHQKEYDRIRGLLDDLEMELQKAQDELAAVDLAVEQEWEVFDQQFEGVMKSSLPSPRGAKQRNLRCMGWKRTTDGRWTGKRMPSRDKSCFELISHEDAVGYCVVRDDDTDEYFRVMKSDSSSLPSTAMVTCRVAPYFANFPAEIERVILTEGDAQQQLSKVSGNGIVVVVNAGEMQQAVALVEKLRGLQCVLPMELWLTDDNGETVMAELRSLLAQTKAKNNVNVEIRSMKARGSPVAARIHAISHSSFESVLYLSVATTPLRDPTYLFSLPEFVSAGTLFWPDVFHPRTTESNIQPASLLWEYLDMAFVDMFEQDDHQLLIRRDLAVQRGLRVVELFATHQPDIFTRMKLVENGKDLFRLAWLKSRVPFHMVAVPPTLGGSVLASEPFRFCGSHVMQHDPSGEPLFLHRQRDAAPELYESIEYAQVFDWRSRSVHGVTTSRLSRLRVMKDYSVKSHLPAGNDASRCYGFTRDSGGDGSVATRPWREVVEQKELVA